MPSSDGMPSKDIKSFSYMEPWFHVTKRLLQGKSVKKNHFLTRTLKPFQAETCCGYYGASGMNTAGNDCIMIPGAQKAADNVAVAATQCGGRKGLGTASDGASATICSKSIQGIWLHMMLFAI